MEPNRKATVVFWLRVTMATLALLLGSVVLRG
jgi:hypothetical protein